jgi:hypothetical protein
LASTGEQESDGGFLAKQRYRDTTSETPPVRIARRNYAVAASMGKIVFKITRLYSIVEHEQPPVMGA